MTILDVFLEGLPAPVGALSRTSTGDLQFCYLRDDLAHPLSLSLSLSLPIREAPFDDLPTRAFFENLMFENAQRDQILQRYGLEFGDTVGLLTHLGRDCPGAVSVVPQGEGPGKLPGNLETDCDPIDNLQQIMASLRDHRRLPPDTKDPSPLAGVEGKVAVALLPDGRMALPKAGLNVPTTHILKVPRRADSRLVDHEHILMQIARTVQPHPVGETAIIEVGDVRGLLITRFDRVINGPAVRRLHQEDFCQALGLGSALKYQRNGRGESVFDARGMGRILAQTDNPAGARQALFEGTVVNLLLGNTDNHAKNHALLYHGARPQLAPFYDIVPILLDGNVTHQLAFDIGAAQMTDEINPGDLADFARALGYRRMIPALTMRLREITEDVIAHIGQMRGPVKKRVGDVIAEQARWVAHALEFSPDIPERDLMVIVRP